MKNYRETAANVASMRRTCVVRLMAVLIPMVNWRLLAFGVLADVVSQEKYEHLPQHSTK